MAAATTISTPAPIDPAAAVMALLDANARVLASHAFEHGARSDVETYRALRILGMSPDDIAIHFDAVMSGVHNLRSHR